MKTSDFVTLIGHRNFGCLCESSDRFIFSPTDILSIEQPDLNKILQNEGGLSVQITSKSGATTVVVRAWKSLLYSPPTEVRVLRRNQNSDPLPLKAERTEIPLEP